VSNDYGVLLEDKGIALRGLFVIDLKAFLRYKVNTRPQHRRSVEETLRVIQALQTGGLCQAEWKARSEDFEFHNHTTKSGDEHAEFNWCLSPVFYSGVESMPMRIGTPKPSFEGATEWLNGSAAEANPIQKVNRP